MNPDVPSTPPPFHLYAARKLGSPFTRKLQTAQRAYLSMKPLQEKSGLWPELPFSL